MNTSFRGGYGGERFVNNCSKLANSPEAGGTAAGIDGGLEFARDDCLAGERISDCGAEIGGAVVIPRLRLPAKPAKGLLHRTVLERMKADDGKHSSGLESRKCGRQGTLERAKFVVYCNPNALKGAGGRMNARSETISRRYGIGNQLRECRGASQRAGAACGEDGAHHSSCMSLLSISANGTVEHLLGSGLEPERGRHTVTRIHAHIGRSISPERKSTFGFVELKRRHAQIEENAIQTGELERGQITKVTIKQRETSGIGRVQFLGARSRVRIAVKRGDAAIRGGL